MKKKEQFIASIIFHLLLPLVPLMAELIVNKQIETKELLLVASMYSVTTVLSTTSILQFSVGIILSLLCSLIYAMGGNHIETYYPIIAMSLIFMFHVMERYRLHISEEEKYFRF